MVFLLLFAAIATGDQSSAFGNQLSAISPDHPRWLMADG
jgi:hypothetical protein